MILFPPLIPLTNDDSLEKQSPQLSPKACQVVQTPAWRSLSAKLTLPFPLSDEICLRT